MNHGTNEFEVKPVPTAGLFKLFEPPKANAGVAAEAAEPVFNDVLAGAEPNENAGLEAPSVVAELCPGVAFVVVFPPKEKAGLLDPGAAALFEVGVAPKEKAGLFWLPNIVYSCKQKGLCGLFTAKANFFEFFGNFLHLVMLT